MCYPNATVVHPPGLDLFNVGQVVCRVHIGKKSIVHRFRIATCIVFYIRLIARLLFDQRITCLGGTSCICVILPKLRLKNTLRSRINV